MKTVVLILLAALLLGGSIPIYAGDVNLAQNGNFEQVDGKGFPGHWIKKKWDRQASSLYLEKENPFAGMYSAAIENKKPTISCWVQFIKVKPGKVYKISCQVKTAGVIADGKGAGLSVLGTEAFSHPIYDTAGQWIEVVLYGETGPGQTDIGAALQLGGTGNLSQGKVYFDDFRVEEVEVFPEGISVAQFNKKIESVQNTVEKKKSKLPGQITLIVLILFSAFWAIYFILLKKRKQQPAAVTIKNLKSETPPSFSKKDYLLVTALTLVYGVIAFINIGSLSHSPQTFWQPAENGENIVVDLGEIREVKRIGYYFCMGRGSFGIDFSRDGQNWEYRRAIDQSSFYDRLEWRFLDLKKVQPARYIKVSSLRPGVMLNEVVFFARGSQEPLPIAGVLSSTEPTVKTLGKPGNLFDEPDTLELHPGYLTGMYFDEVYHARTAYEHLMGIEPTEITHPPLGKVIISIGILLFGMTPFGWRFMGLLLGILMVPMMYRFGLTVFKKTRYAFITAFLMAFDFMHFTQTRIATIDVYGLFFIILMFYFMYRYYMANFYVLGLHKTLRLLFLCGLFFGLGVASKWITLYGGAGLAVILFTSLFQRFREYRQARAILAGSEPQEEEVLARCRHIKSVFFRYTAATLSWCVLFFIVIPAIIYTLSYIPIMKSGTGHGLDYVVENQVEMFVYHSKVKDTHPFSSTWWEWPIMKYPIWYHHGEHGIPEGKISTIVAMGNPAIWWLGILAVPLAYVLALKRRDRMMFIVLIGFAFQYLTWAVAPRDCTFIYHYFGAVPFLIMCIVYMFHRLEQEKPKSKIFVNIYLVLTGCLFIMFYPIISGMVVSKSYVATFLKWFKTWIFFT